MDKWRKAACVRLHDEHLVIIIKDADDILEMPFHDRGIAIETSTLKKIFESLGIELFPFSEYFKGKEHQSWLGDSEPLFEIQYAIYGSEDQVNVYEIDVNTEDRILNLILHCRNENDAWVESFSYSGRFSIQWLNEA